MLLQNMGRGQAKHGQKERCVYKQVSPFLTSLASKEKIECFFSKAVHDSLSVWSRTSASKLPPQGGRLGSKFCLFLSTHSLFQSINKSISLSLSLIYFSLPFSIIALISSTVPQCHTEPEHSVPAAQHDKGCGTSPPSCSWAFIEDI